MSYATRDDGTHKIAAEEAKEPHTGRFSPRGIDGKTKEDSY
jgi:hypothetical protein